MLNTTGALSFLIETIFGAYSIIVMARFVLQLVRADFYNPISQFILKATSPVLRPLRKIIPGWGGIDTASIVLLFALQAIKVLILISLNNQLSHINTMIVLFETSKAVIRLALDFILYSIFIEVILSWVAPQGGNPIALLVRQITDPIISPVRKRLPSTGGIDFSPMIVMLGIVFIKILLGL